ncbi:hypothetical protein HanRHA438_Chr06g0249751 [Helianthus annuus]|nr:hypothetical protein HanRHA438_Chr06g0249751 [Helianthus annuus]
MIIDLGLLMLLKKSYGSPVEVLLNRRNPPTRLEVRTSAGSKYFKLFGLDLTDL